MGNEINIEDRMMMSHDHDDDDEDGNENNDHGVDRSYVHHIHHNRANVQRQIIFTRVMV